MIGVRVVALAGLLLCILPAPSGAFARAPETATVYDYLTLVLTWSPTYCAQERENGRDGDDALQCGANARPYSFVVHGLWPQYERKRGDARWPEYCAGRRAPYVSEDTIADMLAIMPSRDLVIHEWRKHGTCFGPDPDDYFAATELLFETVRIPNRFREPRKTILTSPDSLEQSFVDANDWLEPEMISIHCGNRRDRARLRDIRICFTADLEPTACGPNERRACRADTLVLPPAR